MDGHQPDTWTLMIVLLHWMTDDGWNGLNPPGEHDSVCHARMSAG
jgi:hypothetical protein